MPIVTPGSGELDVRLVGDLAPIRVLDEDTVERLWIAQSGPGLQMLAYLAEETAQFDWIILSPCNAAIVEGLESGSIALRDAVVGTWMWLVQRRIDGSLSAWTVDEQWFPEVNLPRPGVRLRLEHSPAITTRAIGESIGRGTAPASVVAWVADSTRKAIKVLLDYMFEFDKGGRPTDEARSLYDLPVRSLAFHSFEVGLGLPESQMGREKVQQAVTLLQSGFDWLASDPSEPFLPNSSAEERIAVLAALKTLAPPKHGLIERVEVGGLCMRRVGNLDRAARAKLQTEITAVHAETPITLVGRVRELDRDRGTFILRDVNDRPEIRGVISQETVDEFVEYFITEQRVAVIGVQRSSRFYAHAVAPIADGRRDGGTHDEKGD
jgi:hypothetical protein